jgi:predicted metalloprotease with PDZ domain
MNKGKALLLCTLALGVVLATSASAEIDYRVKVDNDKAKLDVTITIPASKGPVSLQMPSWMPGSYVYGNFYENVSDVLATDGKGAQLTVTHPDKSTWSVDSPDGPVQFSYSVPARGQRRFADRDTSYLQISGAATYMYVVNHKQEKCKVTFDVPKGWPLMLSLDADKAPNTFDAPFYDVLADAPVSTGPGLEILQYRMHGNDHYIVLEGAARDEVDKDKILKDCRFVSAAETNFFGNTPYNKYVWHFIAYDAPDGGGGLEHLGSTQISLSTGMGPGLESVLSHEYFHLWNVKRSRPKVLGPFDYTTLPKTGLLWWYEGVTDYYASVIPYRYGEWKQDQFFKNLVRNMDAVENNPARLEISPYQASYRVAEANEGRGNSNGYKISYYNLGWLCGMCLDIEIRSQTGNKHSLDDVARALYNMCKDYKPGIAEDEIRKQCVKFGGSALGPFFDKVVMNPGELPIDEQLAKVGLKVETKDEPYVDLGFIAFRSSEGTGLSVGRIHGPAENILQTGDIVTSINGTSLAGNPRTAGAAFAKLRDSAVAGSAMSLEIARDGKPMTVTVTPVAATRKVHQIGEDPAASAGAVALRGEWLFTKKLNGM